MLKEIIIALIPVVGNVVVIIVSLIFLNKKITSLYNNPATKLMTFQLDCEKSILTMVFERESIAKSLDTCTRDIIYKKIPLSNGFILLGITQEDSSSIRAALRVVLNTPFFERTHIKLLVNNVVGENSISFGSGELGEKSDTTHVDCFSENDLLSIKVNDGTVFGPIEAKCLTTSNIL